VPQTVPQVVSTSTTAPSPLSRRRLNRAALAPVLAVSLALLPSVLRASDTAACPFGLGAGIVYAADDGSTTTVTPTERPDVLRERVQLPEGDGYELEALFGLFELTTADFDASGVDEGTRFTSAYAVSPTLPAPGTSVQDVTAQVTGASEAFTRRHDIEAGALGDVVLGGCPYQGYPVEVRVTEDESRIVHRFMMVPALGMAVYVGFQDQDGSVDYSITSVSALPTAEPAK
jgi:hypothetical protein